jgi:DNA-binding transcriptional LysR family regulator
LEVRHLRAFVTLVEQRNMTAAAERLGVAQSTISEALTALERALGTRMIARRRGGHSIDFTPAGQALLPHARRVLASLEDAHVAVAAVAADVNGRVELVANESVSTYLLPAALAVVRRNWPNMQFAVTVGMCPSTHEGLSSGRFDVGLMLQVPSCATSNATEPSRVVSPRTTRELKQVPLVVFSGAQHPLTARDQPSDIPRDDLAPYPLFVTDGQGYFYDALRRFFRSDALTGPRLHSTGSVEGVKRSVVANPNGLGVLPEYAVAEDLGAGLIRAITIRPTAPSLSLHALLYRARTPMHPAIAELMDVLSTTLGGH